MSADRLFRITGVETPRGQRHVQVRIVTDSAGQEFQLHELLLVYPNGDWDYVDTVDANGAMGWLIGQE